MTRVLPQHLKIALQNFLGCDNQKYIFVASSNKGSLRVNHVEVPAGHLVRIDNRRDVITLNGTREHASITLIKSVVVVNKEEELPPRTIVAAAFRYNNLPVDGRLESRVFIGIRHADMLMNEAISMHQKAYPEHVDIMETQEIEQGFVDNFGQFVNRKTALEIVKASGQTFYPKRNRGDDRLFSEGVW